MLTNEPQLILEKPLRVINLGLETFYESLRSQEVEAIQVAWKPPAEGNQKLADILSQLR
ncbi:MAG: fdrA domain protein [bacterium]